jgi:hypothetical protein
VLEQGTDADEYSYPSMAWADGHLWVSYTDHRTRIAWQRFALRGGASIAAGASGAAGVSNAAGASSAAGVGSAAGARATPLGAAP